MKAEWDIEFDKTPNHANFTTTMTARKVLKIDGRPIDEMKDDYLEEVKQYFFDKWNWETNDPNDREIFEELQAEWEARQERRRNPRRLTATWTVEAQQDYESAWGVDLEEEITKALSEEIVKEIVEELEVDPHKKWVEKLKKMLKQ